MRIREKAFIFDLDGTVALHMNPDGTQRRGHFDYSRVSEDLPNTPVITQVQLTSLLYQPIGMSGREDFSRRDTIAWIYLHMKMTYYPLFMRKTGDHRKDVIIKKEIYLRYVEPRFDVVLAFDDRNQVVDMWREMGITCLQVAPGNF